MILLNDLCIAHYLKSIHYTRPEILCRAVRYIHAIQPQMPPTTMHPKIKNILKKGNSLSLSTTWTRRNFTEDQKELSRITDSMRECLPRHINTSMAYLGF